MYTGFPLSVSSEHFGTKEGEVMSTSVYLERLLSGGDPGPKGFSCQQASLRVMI